MADLTGEYERLLGLARRETRNARVAYESAKRNGYSDYPDRLAAYVRARARLADLEQSGRSTDAG